MGMNWGADPMAVDVEAIAAEMRPALYAWFSSRIVIWDDKLLTTTGYDPFADTGGTSNAAVVYDSGENGAICQPIRSPARIEQGGQSGAIMGIRFQAKREPAVAGVLRAGLRVAVSGGQDVELPNFVFQLQDSIDSSFQWGRIMEAVVLTNGAS